MLFNIYHIRYTIPVHILIKSKFQMYNVCPHTQRICHLPTQKLIYTWKITIIKGIILFHVFSSLWKALCKHHCQWVYRHWWIHGINIHNCVYWWLLRRWASCIGKEMSHVGHIHLFMADCGSRNKACICVISLKMAEIWEKCPAWYLIKTCVCIFNKVVVTEKEF